MSSDKIRQELLVDETKLQEEQLTRLKKHLALNKEGNVFILEPTKYRHKDLIALYLIGIRYAKDAELRKSESITLSELSSSLGIGTQQLAARIAELKNEGKIESINRGEYRILFARVPWILNEIENLMNR